MNWLLCRLGWHEKYFHEWPHCDDMKVHEFWYCKHCHQMFVFILNKDRERVKFGGAEK